MDERNDRAILAVDLLRFACALLVVCFHYFTAFARGPSQAGAGLLAGLPIGDGSAWSWAGWVGVELFFVVSGLVIATSADGTAATAFVRRRVLRLVPAAWICTSVTFLVLAAETARPGLAHSWLLSMTFWPQGIPVDPSYWTLGIECAFYLLIALCLGQAGNPRRIEARGVALGWWSTAFWGVAIAAGWWGTRVFDYRPIQLLLLPHGVFFALGVLARGMLAEGPSVRRMAPFAVFLSAGLVEIVARAGERAATLHLGHGPGLPLGLFLAGLAIILGARRLQPGLARHVRAGVAVRLGLMTYPFYLIHQEVGAAMIAGLMHAGAGFGVAAGVTLMAMIAIAWGIVEWLEPALRRSLARALRPAPAAAAAAGSRPPSPRPAPARRSAG